jgi:hypothetical protein
VERTVPQDTLLKYSHPVIDFVSRSLAKKRDGLKPSAAFPAPPRVEPPPGWRGSLPDFIIFEALVARGWHNLAPGETGVKLDHMGLITFYDLTLSSLVDSCHGKGRLHHRLEGILAAELQSVLTRKQCCSTAAARAASTGEA